MTSTPRVGDTVHYVAHGTPVRDDGTQAHPSVCRAAFVTSVSAAAGDAESTVTLTVVTPTGTHSNSVPHHKGHTSPDSDPVSILCEATGLFHTPGTWHHRWQGTDPHAASTGWRSIGHVTRGDTRGEAFIGPFGTPAPDTASRAPTFADATAEAAAVLKQARENVGMESTDRLTDIARTWTDLAARITEHHEATRL